MRGAGLIMARLAMLTSDAGKIFGKEGPTRMGTFGVCLAGSIFLRVALVRGAGASAPAEEGMVQVCGASSLEVTASPPSPS
jgi:hypothetical protein